jgi:hypothetical protein
VAKKKPEGLATNPADALAGVETPRMKWKVIAQIGAILVGLWVTAGVAVPFIGFWGIGVVGVLTLAALGFGIYIWRLTSRSRAIVDIMKGATDDEGRRHAIEALEGESSKDAMKALAQAQLLSQTDPQEAMRVLERIELKKAPTMVQDDLRAQLGLLYLRNQRVRDAREMVEPIRLDKRPDARSKALYAAVMAEAFARTGSGVEAGKLMETYPPDEAEQAETQALLWRAKVFTSFALKKRGLAQKAMEALARIEPNMVAAFTLKGHPPEIVQMAKQTLGRAGLGPKMKMKHTR